VASIIFWLITRERRYSFSGS